MLIARYHNGVQSPKIVFREYKDYVVEALVISRVSNVLKYVFS